MCFHGGLLGVALALVAFARAQRIDPLAPGRPRRRLRADRPVLRPLANFINGELWGRATHVPWGMVFCAAYRDRPTAAARRPGAAASQPALRGDPGGSGAVPVLRWATHRQAWLSRRGAVTGLFLIGYGLSGSRLENVRLPDAGLHNLPLGLTMGIMLSIPMLLAGGWLIWRA